MIHLNMEGGRQAISSGSCRCRTQGYLTLNGRFFQNKNHHTYPELLFSVLLVMTDAGGRLDTRGTSFFVWVCTTPKHITNLLSNEQSGVRVKEMPVMKMPVFDNTRLAEVMEVGIYVGLN